MPAGLRASTGRVCGLASWIRPDIQGVAGLEHLRQDLNERAATRSEGRVRELIIRSLVVQ